MVSKSNTSTTNLRDHEICLLKYFIFNDELRSTCDFNQFLFNKGKGIYEVFRVIDGIPLFLQEHIDRYYKSLKMGGYTPNLSRFKLTSRLQTLIETNQLKQGNIRFQYLKSDDRETFLAWVTKTVYPASNDYKDGVDLMSLNAVRELPRLKSINLPARVKANKMIADHDIFEVLLIGDDKTITEGSRSNIFFVRDGQLYTPPLSRILPGITRSEVIALARKQKIKIITDLIPFDDTKNFEAAFLTSTSMKILPVRSIDRFCFEIDNTLINQLMKLYDQRIKTNLTNFSRDKT